ncbi:MAG TPA: helix-turn-helix domain-containing protein [Armatimonadota bacterium]|nr:helix-turn-helix domain-containing protein [Armatimonadota bacterium]
MPEDHDNREEMLTPQEAADWLKVSVDTVYRWIDEGTLPALKIGGTYRILRSAVLAMNATGRDAAARGGKRQGEAAEGEDR